MISIQKESRTAGDRVLLPSSLSQSNRRQSDSGRRKVFSMDSDVLKRSGVSEVVMVIKEAKVGKEEPAVVVVKQKEEPAEGEEEQLHPYHFNASGPRNLSSPNWRDLFRSSWKDANYKRMVMACLIQAVYLLELDRQANRSVETALASNWWKPFKYKLISTLTDERDGSIYGAILEWDRSAAMSDFILIRPTGAPRAILVLRGTLLNRPTMRRDLEDDLRFLAWESLKGSVRFNGALEGVRSLVERFGSGNVCVGGHSLGAGFALQVCKTMAMDHGLFVECHLFNPPSFSIGMSLKSFAEKAGSAWKKVRSVVLPLKKVDREEETTTITTTTAAPAATAHGGGGGKFVPNLYLNNSDYICCHYTSRNSSGSNGTSSEKKESAVDEVGAKMFVMANGPQRFLEAHGLEQWWSDDMELQLALHHSNLISRQLR